jgi:hypothetical protein
MTLSPGGRMNPGRDHEAEKSVYYAITGAIVSFYFTRTEIELVKWGLLLPTVFSLGLAILFFYGGKFLKNSRNDIYELGQTLGLKLAPEFKILGFLLHILSGILLLTGGSLLTIIVLR